MLWFMTDPFMSVVGDGVLYCAREPRIISLIHCWTMNIKVHICETQNVTLECCDSKLVLSQFSGHYFIYINYP